MVALRSSLMIMSRCAPLWVAILGFAVPQSNIINVYNKWGEHHVLCDVIIIICTYELGYAPLFLWYV